MHEIPPPGADVSIGLVAAGGAPPTQRPVFTGESLTSRVVRGGGWVVTSKVAARLIDFVKIAVLARLLTPDDFGLFGIVTLAMVCVQTLSQTGFNVALIQRSDDAAEYLDTVWTADLLRGIALALILYVGAPFVGSAFDEPGAVSPLRYMGLSVALSGLTNVGIVLFHREIEFRRVFIFNILSAIISLAIGLVLAYTLRSVWALVGANFALVGSRCILSYILHPYRPRLAFRPQQAAELFRFSRWTWAASVIGFLATYGDNAVVGKMLSASALGLYQLAFLLANTPATEVSHVTSTIMMPAYARVQHDPERLGKGFLSVFEVVFSLAFPLTVFLVLASESIILGTVGPQWTGAVTLLKILAVAGLLRAVAATAGPLFVGIGKPHLDFWMNFGRVAVTAATIYPLMLWLGLAGTCWSVVLGLGATLPVWAKVVKTTGVGWGDVAARLIPGAVVGSLVPLALTIGAMAPDLGWTGRLAIDSALVAALGLAASWVMQRYLGTGIFAHVARLLAMRRDGADSVTRAHA